MKIAHLVAAALLTVAVAACTSDDEDNAGGAGYGPGAGAAGAQEAGGPGGPGGGITATSLDAQTQELKQQVGDTILFKFDSSNISPEAEAILQRQAAYMQKYPNLTFTVEGHCDDRGTREYNLALGDRRATAAKNALVALGVSAQRLHTVSYGKERPVAVGDNEAAWARNRRAVTVID